MTNPCTARHVQRRQGNKETPNDPVTSKSVVAEFSGQLGCGHGGDPHQPIKRSPFKTAAEPGVIEQALKLVSGLRSKAEQTSLSKFEQIQRGEVEL